MRGNFCSNFNHRKANAPVRACPQCGEIVNAAIPAKFCSEEEHAKERRRRSRFCINCGELLMK